MINDDHKLFKIQLRLNIETIMFSIYIRLYRIQINELFNKFNLKVFKYKSIYVKNIKLQSITTNIYLLKDFRYTQTYKQH